MNRIERAIFRALVRLYPARFRDAYAEDMEFLFAERLDQCSGISAAGASLIAPWGFSLSNRSITSIPGS